MEIIQLALNYYFSKEFISIGKYYWLSGISNSKGISQQKRIKTIKLTSFCASLFVLFETFIKSISKKKSVCVIILDILNHSVTVYVVFLSVIFEVKKFLVCIEKKMNFRTKEEIESCPCKSQCFFSWYFRPREKLTPICTGVLCTIID